jgi:hypothetical protein
MHQIELA